MKTINKLRLLISAICTLPFITGSLAAVNIGNIEAPNFKHDFRYSPTPPFPPNLSLELLIEHYYGGTALLPNVSANFDLDNQFALRIAAPPGQKFRVTPPVGQQVTLRADLGWTDATAPSGTYAYGTTSISFEGFEGTPLTFVEMDSLMITSHRNFKFHISSAPIDGEILFSSISLTATVPFTYTGSGILNYAPDIISYLGFFNYTQAVNDPGSFASVVPEPSTSVLLLSAIIPAVAKMRRRSPKGISRSI